MAFSSKYEILDWYERQPRSLTEEFIDSVPWEEVRRHPFDERFIPVLLYMRDVETLTDMYWEELRRTPTGRDPVIAKFMERWGIEEVTHGEVLDRFLNELGVSSGRTWKDDIRRAVPSIYHAKTYLITFLTNLAGSRFTGTHMAFGAAHEMTTGQAYRRLMELADHPVLSMILRAIIREESAHTHFYWSMARLELEQSKASQRLARTILAKFYYPVGQGSLAPERTRQVVGTLFRDPEALDSLDTTVTKRFQQLPGFDGISNITETIGRTAGTFSAA